MRQQVPFDGQLNSLLDIVINHQVGGINIPAFHCKFFEPRFDDKWNEHELIPQIQ
jgi:hypothetical protein